MVLIVAALAVLAAPEALRPPGSAATEALAFGRSLLDEGDNYRAIGELKRSLFLKAEGAEASQARQLIGVAYLRGEQYEAAITHYRSIAAQASPEARAPLLLQVGYGYYLWGRYPEALRELSAYLWSYGGQADPSAQRARYLLGWTELGLEDFAAAQRRFDELPGLTFKAELSSSIADLERLPSRSPWIAGVLSVVPGLGHVYVGQPLIGLGALAWNGLFGFALYDSIRQGSIGTAVVWGLLEVLWYSGTVFGAVSAAHKFNRDVRLNAMEGLRRRYDDRPEEWPPRAPFPSAP